MVGLQLSYVTAVGAGGLSRLLPNEWDVDADLRKIPDSVEEFTGFYVGLDIVGGDGFGYSPANLYEPTGKAGVRNVQLPSDYGHFRIPDTKHLVKSQAIMDWINSYTPTNTPQLNKTFVSDSSRHSLGGGSLAWYQKTLGARVAAADPGQAGEST